jgi:uncharacterized protein YcbK (DUF882 family)
MMLTEHFSLAEMTRSEWAMRMGVVNSPDSRQSYALTQLCSHVLEPLRSYRGPIVISSGFRSGRVNVAIGGAPTSQHLSGEAADFQIPELPNIEVVHVIRTLALPFDQVIYEFGPAGWIHVSYGPRARREALSSSFSGGKVVYLPLI